MKKWTIIFKIAQGVFYAFAVFMFTWWLWSWADIVADNRLPNPTHSEYNFFILTTQHSLTNK